MADEQQDVPELPKSRLGSRARVEQDSEAFERAGLRLLRFLEDTERSDDAEEKEYEVDDVSSDEQQDQPEGNKGTFDSPHILGQGRKKREPPPLPKVKVHPDILKSQKEAKARLERLAIERARLQLQIAKNKALEELWISHQQWERETGRENIAKGNPYARSVMTPDELQQAQEEARLKYERIFSRIAGTDSDLARSRYVSPVPAKKSRLKSRLQPWLGFLVFLAILVAMAMYGAFFAKPAYEGPPYFGDEGPPYIPTFGG